MRPGLKAQQGEHNGTRPAARKASLNAPVQSVHSAGLLYRRLRVPERFCTTAPWKGAALVYGGDIRVGDLTGDGRADFLVYRSDGESGLKPCFLGAFSGEGKILWYAGGGGTQPLRPGPVTLYDFDGDGRDEVLCFFRDPLKRALKQSCADIVVQIRDGLTGRVIRQNAPAEITVRKGWGANWCHQRLFIANLRGRDRPGYFIVKLGDTVVACNDQLSVLWTYKIRWNDYGRCSAYIPALGDMDGDGREEVNGGYYLLDSFGKPLWEKQLAPHMDSVAIVKWDGGRMRALCSGGGHIMDKQGNAVMCLGTEMVPHGQEARVADFVPGSPGPELIIRCRGHAPDVLVVNTRGRILSAFRLNSSPNETGKEVVYWNGKNAAALLYNGGCLFDGKGEVAVRLPGLPAPVGPAKMGWYHCVAADICGDLREEVAVYNPWAASVYIYTQSPVGKTAYAGYRPGPRQYNVRLVD